MEIFDEFHIFLFLTATTLNVFVNSDIMTNTDADVTSDALPCIVDVLQIQRDCLIAYVCPDCRYFESGSVRVCSKKKLTNQFENYRFDLYLEAGEIPWRVEQNRFTNGSCPEYPTCTSCPDDRVYGWGTIGGPCPQETRADKYGRCRQDLN